MIDNTEYTHEEIEEKVNRWWYGEGMLPIDVALRKTIFNTIDGIKEQLKIASSRVFVLLQKSETELEFVSLKRKDKTGIMTNTDEFKELSKKFEEEINS